MTHYFAPLIDKSPETIIADKGKILNNFDKTCLETTIDKAEKRCFDLRSFKQEKLRTSRTI